MKAAAFILFSLFSVCSVAQITFTRAELEAAADSALKGMNAVRNEAELRRAVTHFTVAINKYEAAYLNCDSINRKNKASLAYMEGKYNTLLSKFNGEQMATAKLRPWATIGKITIYGALIGGVAFGGVTLYQQFAP